MSASEYHPLAPYTSEAGTREEINDEWSGFDQLPPSESGHCEAANDSEEPLLALRPDENGGEVDKWALRCLLLQHASSTFTAGSYDFASFLFLIEVFKDTLVPASLVGLLTKLAGLVFSGYMGGLVDKYPRLPLVRATIGAEKLFKGANYILFLVLFGPLLALAQPAFHGNAPLGSVIATWTILMLTITCSTMLGLANTTLEVAIERDWVMTIARGDGKTLTKLNTGMRRIDLLSKLISPLFVSLLTSTIGYFRTTCVLLGWVAITAVVEYLWIRIVYTHFPILARSAPMETREATNEEMCDLRDSGERAASGLGRIASWVKKEQGDWAEFARLPIFCSSIAIAAIYLTTLSYDGTFIAYIKAARGYDDGFIAAMRGLCVLTGLLGTFLMPRLERQIGLERAGAWSISFELVCLAPTVLAFFYGTGAYGTRGAVWNEVLLFGGIALSRIGLWSFDLCQLKELQQALESHPHRNRLTARQISLQNTFDLLKYALTLAASTPREFKWTALVSWLAVAGGAGSYAVYLRRVRGHLVHLEWFKKGR